MLDCIDPNTGGRGNGENLHAFEHEAPEPGEFADNEGIAFAKFAQDSCNPAFAPWDLAGHLFLDELDTAEILLVGKDEDIGPVLVQVLGVLGDPQVSDGPGRFFQAPSAKLKEATASDIFRRLNSYSRQHSLYIAMKAFGQIIRSLFILRYIDQVELRQAIEKQLNRVELANSFTRAIAVGNPRGLEHAEKSEQEIAESCNRLIKTASSAGTIYT